MSGLLPSFLSSAQLEIRIGATVLAYCQNLSFTDDMATVPVGGIGSYTMHALEPVGYMGRGSMTITHYSKAVLERIGNAGANTVPANIKTKDTDNSLLRSEFFNPIQLIISRTFDINVYERAVSNEQVVSGMRLVYQLQDCRMTNLSLTFTPGSLINQTVSFLCMGLADLTSEDVGKKVTSKTEKPKA